MFNVLFICSGNSARSIMAEAVINDPELGGGRFCGFSAGSRPKGSVHPLTLETLVDAGFSINGLQSQSWDNFAEAVRDAPTMDFVFTVCDAAAKETCPIWPGQPVTAHWSIPDPAKAAGGPDDQRRAFRDTLARLRRRIELFAALPLDTLNRMALEARLEEIGRDE